MGNYATRLTPPDIAFVTVTHIHADHIGNVDRFPTSMLLILKAEFNWAFAPGKRPLVKKDRPMRLLEGDLDVLGDASEKPAQAWINHDLPAFDGQRHAPQSTSERRQPAGSCSSSRPLPGRGVSNFMVCSTAHNAA